MADDESVIEVRLGSVGATEWIAELTDALGRRPRLLSAAIEPLGGVTRGVAHIAVSTELRSAGITWLQDRGHHARAASYPSSGYRT